VGPPFREASTLSYSGPCPTYPLLSSLSLCSLTSLSAAISYLESSLFPHGAHVQVWDLHARQTVGVHGGGKGGGSPSSTPLHRSSSTDLSSSSLWRSPASCPSSTLLSLPWSPQSSAPMDPVPSLPLHPSPSHLSSRRPLPAGKKARVRTSWAATIGNLLHHLLSYQATVLCNVKVELFIFIVIINERYSTVSLLM
jgi:hypothetical protein